MERKNIVPGIWLAALGCFVIAGVTGSLLRFGLLRGLPAGLSIVNVRHAHSHLMYFGWVTPALMILIMTWLPKLTGRRVPTKMRWVMVATIVAALAAYVMFIQYGYQATQIAGRRLPLSVMAATVNVIAWYLFAFFYYRSTKQVARTRPFRFWDAAIGFMVLASFGAWGVAIVSRLGISDPFWSQAMTHLFLDLFSEGWFVLAILGFISTVHSPRSDRVAHWGEQLVVIGLPVVFLLALPVGLVPAGLRAIASVGGGLVSIGLFLLIWAMWPTMKAGLSTWQIPLAFLALKALLGLGMVLPVTARWAQQNGLRIFYLHVLLLGFITLGLVVAAREVWGRLAVPGQRWLVLVVIFLILTLVPLTGFWPNDWSGRWVLQFAAWASLGPVIVMIGMLLSLVANQKGTAIDNTSVTFQVDD